MKTAFRDAVDEVRERYGLSALTRATLLGRDQGVKYPAGFRIPDDREAADLIALGMKAHQDKLAKNKAANAA